MNSTPLNELNTIKYMLCKNEINYKTAKKMAQPFIDIMNKKAKELAKKYHLRPKLISFAGFMR